MLLKNFIYTKIYSIILLVIIMDTWLQYLIIAVVLILVLLIVIKLTRRDFRIEANKLITYLGGKDNIVSAEANMSRFKVILKDVSIVNKDAIEKLGAKGIVEIDNQLKIIFGPNAKELKRYIDDIV